HLARHAEAVARQAQVGDHVAHHPLGLAVGVALGVVEEVDAVVPGSRDHLACRAPPDLVAEGHPGAEGQRRELQAGGSEAAVLHAVAPSVVGAMVRNRAQETAGGGGGGAGGAAPGAFGDTGGAGGAGGGGGSGIATGSGTV